MPYDPFLTLEQNGVRALQRLQADNPEIFDEEQSAELSRMIASAGVPLSSGSTKDFDLGDTLLQAGSGFIQGFTTLEVGAEPENDYEYVARNLGHLLGFIGLIPGVGSVGKLGATALIRGSALIGRGLKAARLGEMAARVENLALLDQLPRFMRVKSVPMMAADKFMESKAGAWMFRGAREGLGHFKMLEKAMAENGIGTAMLQKGFHLGIASAVSAAPIYRLDLENRLHALAQGFEAGVVFGGIGNLFSKAGPWGSSARRILSDGSEREALANVVARSAASALYMGLPSTMRGDPTPIQVYDWVSGAVFGYLEKPAYMAEAGRFWHKNMRVPGGQKMLLRPEKLDGWDTLSELAKEEVTHWGDLYLGRLETRYNGYTNVGVGIGQSVKAALEKLLAERRIDAQAYEEMIEGERVNVEYALEETAARERGLTDEQEIRTAAHDGLRTRMAERGRAERELYEQIIKEREETKAAEARAESDLLARDMQTVMDAFQEEHVSLRFHEPLSDLAAQMEAHFRGTKDARSFAEYEIELVHEMASFAGKKRATMADLEAFVHQVESRYAVHEKPFTVKRGSDLFRGLRVSWMRMVQDRPYMTMMVELDKDGVPHAVMTPEIVDGKPASGERKPLSYMAMALYPEKERAYRASGIIEMDKVLLVDAKTKAERLVDITEVPELKFGRVIADMYFRKNERGVDNPLMFLGGKKDTGVRLFGRALTFPSMEGEHVVYRYIDPVTGKRTRVSLEEKLARIQDAVNRSTEPGKEAENVADMYRALLEDFKADFRDEVGRFTEIPEHRLDAMFEHLFVNNIVAVERLNAGVQVERMIEAGDRFILKAAEWNKRLQVYHSPDYATPGDAFEGLTDLARDGRLPGIIVSVDKDVEHARFTAFRMGKDGFAEEYVMEQHLDGVMFMRSDYFDRLAEHSGSKDVGAAKLTVTFAERGKGAFVGKLLVHRATPELDAHLKAKNWAYKIYDTAAKQRGLREQYTERWNDSIDEIEYRDTRGEVTGSPEETLIPPEGLRLNLSASEHPSLDDVQAKIQFSGQLDQELARAWADRMVSQVWRGDGETMKLYTRYMASRDPKEREALARVIDPRRMSAQAVYNVIQGPDMHDGPLFEKVAREVLTVKETDATEITDIVDPADKVELMREAAIRSAAMTVLKAGPLTPLTLEMKYLREFVDTRLRKYFRDRVVKPHLEGSWSSKSYALDPYLQKRTNLKSGEYMAAEGLREKEVKIAGHWMKLGEAWEELDTLRKEGKQDTPRYEELDEAMEHFVIRVPADSASGIRVLKFRGFVKGARGFGVFLTPEDMAYLGGMDQDGDAVDVYTRIPDAELHARMKEYYRGKAKQWHHKAKTKDGREVDVFDESDPTRFLVEPVGTPEEQARREEVIASALAMFSPRMQLTFHESSTRALRMLGPSLLHARRLLDIVRTAHAENRGIIEWELPFREVIRHKLEGALPGMDRLSREEAEEFTELARLYLDGRLAKGSPPLKRFYELHTKTRTQRFIFRGTAASEHEAERVLRDVVNTMADASKGYILKSREEILSELTRTVMPDVKLYYLTGARKRQVGKGKFTYSGGYEEALDWRGLLEARDHPVYGAMMTLDRTMRGRDLHGNKYPFDEVASRMRRVEFRETLKHAGHSWYLGALHLGRLELKKTPLAGYNLEGIRTMMREFEQLVNRDPRLALYALHHHFRMPESGLDAAVARMERQKLTPERKASEINQLVFNDVYSAVTAIKLMQEGKAFVEDVVASGKMTEADARKELLKISQMAERLKEQDAVLFKNDRSFEALGFRIQGDRKAQELKKEAHEFYQSLSTNGKSYFAYRLLGTLFHQDGPYMGRIAPLKEKVVELERRYNESKATDTTGAGDVALERELSTARFDLGRAEKEYYKTGLSRLAYTWDFIHPSYIRSMLSTVQELLGTVDGKSVDGRKLARAVMGTVHVDGASSLMKEVVPDAAEGTNVQYKIREYHETFLKEAAERLGGPENRLDPATQKLLDKFRDFLYHYPSMIKVLPGLWEGTLSGSYRAQEAPTNIRTATKKQLKTFLRNFMYHGKLPQELSVTERKQALLKRHFFFDPENVAQGLRPFDNRTLATYRELVELPGGEAVFKPVKRVLSTFDTITETWYAMHFSMNGILNEERKKLEEGWRQYQGGIQIVRSLGADGEKIFEIVSDIRQRRMQQAIDAQRNLKIASGETIPDPLYNYEEAAERAEAEFKRLYENGKKLLTYTNHRGQVVTETALQVHARIMELQKAWAERVAKFLRNDSLEAEYIKKRPGTDEVDVRATLDQFARVIRLGGNMPFIGMNGLYRVYHQMMLEKLYVRDYTDPNNIHYERILYRDIRDPEHRARELAKLKAGALNENDWMDYKPIEPLDPQFYFPHNGHPRATIEELIRDRISRKLNAGDSAGALEIEADLKARATQANDETGGWTDALDALDANTVEEQGIAASKLFKVIPTPGHHRGMEPLPGWDKSTEAFVRYEQQMVRGYHKMLGSLMSHSAIGEFRSARVMGEHTDAWAVNMELYNRDNMGYPSTFRQEWLQDPKYMIRNNRLYYTLTDQFMLDKLKKISKRYKLGAASSDAQKQVRKQIADANVRLLTAGAAGDETEVTRITAEIDGYKRKLADVVRESIEKGSYGAEEDLYRKARVLANLEAKWEMISLLSHTKTMANNLFDGSINTAVSTGMGPWMKARDFKYLKANVFTGPEFRTLRDVQRWAEEHGAGESYIVDVFEAGTSGRHESLGDFAAYLGKRVRKEPTEGYSLEQKLERNTAARKIVDAGAFAMRFSERHLRSQAWLAHYLKAREVLGASMKTFKHDDPWLIAMANRGVAGTQFLYNNAARPAFARTMMGRVFTRFQMYAMKSTKMRLDIAREAALLGWDEGTENYWKLERRMVADLFVIGLATMFPASMFSSTLGGPLAQLKEMAVFIFGDDQDKERAFFSPLPYPLSMIQVVSPPVMRIPYATFGTMLTGDWERFWNQHVWTWFPFGRLARDVKGVAEKPALASEKFLGLTVHQMQRRAAKKNSEGKRRRFESPIVGAIM